MKPRFSIIMLLAIPLLLGIVIVSAVRQVWKWEVLSHERRLAEFRQRSFDDVKKHNRSSALIMDSELLPMLAADSYCRHRVNRLDFASTDIRATDAKHVAQLQNVTSMTFYCTHGTKDVLVAARTLPITSIYFEMPDLSAESYLILRDYAQLKKIRLEQVVDDEWIERLRSELPNVIVEAPYLRSKEPGPPK